MGDMSLMTLFHDGGRPPPLRPVQARCLRPCFSFKIRRPLRAQGCEPCRWIAAARPLCDILFVCLLSAQFCFRAKAKR